MQIEQAAGIDGHSAVALEDAAIPALGSLQIHAELDAGVIREDVHLAIQARHKEPAAIHRDAHRGFEAEMHPPQAGVPRARAALAQGELRQDLGVGIAAIPHVGQGDVGLAGDDGDNGACV